MTHNNKNNHVHMQPYDRPEEHRFLDMVVRATINEEYYHARSIAEYAGMVLPKTITLPGGQEVYSTQEYTPRK